MKLALACLVVAACGGGGGASAPDARPAGFAYTATIFVDTSDAPQVASFAIDGVTYPAGQTAVYQHTFASFAESQTSVVTVTATTTRGDTFTFALQPTSCGGNACSEPQGETCANLAAESEEWLFHVGELVGPGSGSAADFSFDPDMGTCDYADGSTAGWAA